MNVRILSALAAALLAAIGLAAPASARDVGPRIIDGDPASISDAPWQVAILSSGVDNDYDAQFCGGSIVAAQWVATAAHCVVQSGNTIRPSDIAILAGKSYLSADDNTSGPRTPVSQIIVHPDYVAATNRNDVAMVRLGAPLTLDGTTKKVIPLPLSVSLPWPAAAPDTARITGWGSTLQPPSVSYPEQLQIAVVDVLANSVCDSAYGATFDGSGELCAGKDSGSPPVKDTCQGDSGGPLAVQVSGTWTLAGITSFGNLCGEPTFPGVYARVTTYMDWMSTQMAKTPSLSVSTTSLDLGTVTVGDRNAGSFSMSNPGSAAVYLQNVTVEAPFTVDTSACGSAVQPGTSCNVSVTFAPGSTGTRTSQVVITDDAPGSPQTVSVTGNAIERVVAPGAPGTPKGKVTTKKAKVSWAASPGATSYKVKVTGRNSKNKKKSATKTTSSTSATVKIKLKKKSKAKVCVQASNSAGTSSWTCKSIKVK